jgi:hypothetical protein
VRGPKISNLLLNAPHKPAITRHQHQLLTKLVIMQVLYPISVFRSRGLAENLILGEILAYKYVKIFSCRTLLLAAILGA